MNKLKLETSIPLWMQQHIASVSFYTADPNNVVKIELNPLTTGVADVSVCTITHCIIKLKNGFVVCGESICIDPQVYTPVKGKTTALQDAVEKAKPFLVCCGFGALQLDNCATL